MIRLIAKVGDKWAMDFEWGFLKPQADPDEEEELEVVELDSETRIGFQPNYSARPEYEGYEDEEYDDRR